MKSTKCERITVEVIAWIGAIATIIGGFYFLWYVIEEIKKHF